MAILTAIIGLLGVLLGSLIVALYQNRQTKISIYQELLNFYEHRKNLLQVKEGSMTTNWEEPSLEVARSRIRSELMMVGSQEVIEAEDSFFSATWSREMDFIHSRSEFKKTGKQVPEYVGIGPHESSAKRMAILKKSHEVFDKRYLRLVNALRNDSGLVAQIKCIFSKPNITLSNRFSTLSAINETLSLINEDTDCVESLYKGRIADKKQQEGATPFDLAVFTQTIIAPHLDNKMLGIQFEPKVSLRQEQINAHNVGWVLGYTFIHFLDEERMSQDLANIEKYFEVMPDGNVTILIKKDGVWKQETSANLANRQNIIDYIINFGNSIFSEHGKSKDDELEKWGIILKNRGRQLPEWKSSA